MEVFRLIAPDWAKKLTKKSIEGQFDEIDLKLMNADGYNVYYFVNPPTSLNSDKPTDGSDIDAFSWVFIDMDLKDKIYASKEQFIETILAADLAPTRIVDSGNGVHVYWRVTNLDAMSYLRFQRRLCRMFKTDEAVSKICQLMRWPGSFNTKRKEFVKCELVCEEEGNIYTAEEFDKLLPSITIADEEYCKQHHDKTYGLNQEIIQFSDKLPEKFGKLLRENSEAKSLWTEPTDDRSMNDWRLGQLMEANDFTKEEAMSVLVQTAKALRRAPVHRVSYAQGIIEKIWTFEKTNLTLYSSVKDILTKPDSVLEGTRIPTWKYVDNTYAGFRTGQVLGLVAGAGVGKTAMALNIFMGFVKSNPELEHFFVPLEQPNREIAQRWKTMCGNNTSLYDKVHILSNYDDNGVFRDLSLYDIEQQILEFEKTTGKKVGCVVIDHMGVLRNENRLGKDEGLKKICKAMKSFAMRTNTILIMQSQTSRDKAGIGDLELNKDAAFGTSEFENFCDYLITLWQPLKRVYALGAPTIMSYKFCKIRHKKQGKDVIQEDVPYTVYFDPETELIRELTESEEKSLTYWVGQATNKRKQDRKTDIVKYTSIRWNNEKS
jgi:KaiC/GvpD/RAD55 family RecA-like ATPase